jgi:Fe2+ or Zn2+ uptake regulation protein
MPTPTLTPAQLAILKVVLMLDGKHRVEGIEGAMKAVSGIPQSEWSPIRSQLKSLENLGMVRQVVVDGDKRTYRITERGRKMVK